MDHLRQMKKQIVNHAPHIPDSVPPGLLIVYLSVFIDMFGGLMASPVLPFLVRSYGKGPLELGYASAAYQFASVFATPLTGSLSDKYGRKRFFVVGFFGSAIGFLTIAMSGSIYGIYAGRFIGGCFGASMPLAQAFISDVSPGPAGGKYRAQLGSVFMAALIFAPGFGGGLAEFGQTTPFYVSAVGAIIGGLICLKEMPSDQSIKKMVAARESAEKKSVASVNSKAETDKVAAEVARSHRPMIILLFLNGMVWAFGFRVFIMMAALYTNLKFKWTPSEFGFSASMVGAVGILTNLLLYAKSQKSIGKHGTGILGASIGAVGYCLIAVSQDTTQSTKLVPKDGQDFWLGPGLFLIGMCVQSFGNAFHNTATSSLISRYADKTHQGSSQGCASSLQALAGMAAPVVGGAMLEIDPNINPIFTMGGFVFCALNLSVILILNRRLPEHHKIAGIDHPETAAGSSSSSSTDVANPVGSDSADGDFELTKRNAGALQMDPAQEVVMLRARVEELEAELAQLRAGAGGGGGGGGGQMDGLSEALIMSSGGGAHQRKGFNSQVI